MIHKPPYHGASDPGDPSPTYGSREQPCGALAAMWFLGGVGSVVTAGLAVWAVLWARRRGR